MKFMFLGALFACALAGCATSSDYDPFVAAVDSQLETRSYQTREIGDTDYQALVTAIVSTLQDYHFRILALDPDLGTIAAYQMTAARGRTSLTVMVRERGEVFSVRMNMSTGPRVDDEAELYQQFFTALQRKLHYLAAG